MSLYNDLKRNRTVFERLTAKNSDEDSDENLKSPTFKTRKFMAPETEIYEQNPFRIPVREAAEREPIQAPVHETAERAPIQAFSLTYGSKNLPNDCKAPDGINHPGLSEPSKTVSADPLESFYHQLEVEARRGSQLAREEGSFE